MKHKPVLTLANKGALIPLVEHNVAAAERYRLAGQPRKNGLSCPQCGSELWDTSPAVQIMTQPPQKHIHCEACDFKGTALT